MKIAFCLYKYFPFGGLQRDFINIAKECQSRGHSIIVYCTHWEGDIPDGFTIITVPKKGISNHTRLKNYDRWVNRHLAQYSVDCVVGFTKMNGLDFYYSAEGCNAEKAESEKGIFYRLMPRHKTHIQLENAVFNQNSHTHALLLAPKQLSDFKKHYHTPDNRFHMLPPGISEHIRYDECSANIRQSFRHEHLIPDDHFLLLQVGSDFKRKGVDRSLLAIADLPEEIRQKITFFVVGQDDATPFQAQAEKSGIASQVTFFSGRDDIDRYMKSADLLLHPAYHEAAGIVILEALAAGLPVLVTRNCGYAFYVENSESGSVIDLPYSQENFNNILKESISNNLKREEWIKNARVFSQTGDIYSLPVKAADIITASHKDLKI